MVRFQIFLPEPLLKALKALSKKTDISVAEHIRRAIENYLRESK
jgi:metal-responsive CopG/Arc/MetJ family transcriptional regulator